MLDLIPPPGPHAFAQDGHPALINYPIPPNLRGSGTQAGSHGAHLRLACVGAKR